MFALNAPLRSLLLLLSLFFLLSSNLMASESSLARSYVVVDPSNPQQDLTQGMWQKDDDPEGKLSFEEVAQNNQGFLFIKEARLNASKLGVLPNLWIKVLLQNDSDQPVKKWLVLPQLMAKVEMRCLGKKGWGKPQFSGMVIPYHQRSFTHKYPAFSVPFDPKDEVTCYFKTIPYLLTIYSFQLFDISSYEKWQAIDWQVGSIFLGIIFIVVIYNLSLFVTFREKLFVYFIGWLFTNSAFILLAEGYPLIWFKEISEKYVQLYVWIFLLLLAAMILTVSYASDFLQLRGENPKLNRLFQLLFWVNTSNAAWFLVAPVAASFLVQPLYIMNILIIIPTACYLGFKGKRLAWWLAGSIGFSFAGYVTFLCLYLGIVEDNFWTRYGLLYGAIIEIVVLSMVMSFRINQKLRDMVDFRTLELSQANDQLATLNVEKNHFLNIAAHDLKTPLANLNTLAYLTTQTLPADAKEAHSNLELIRKSSTEMANLVGKLLDIDRIEAHFEKLELEEVNLVSLCKELLNRYEQTAEERGITLKVEFHTEVAYALALAEWVLQAVENLLSNAMKFSPDQTLITLSISQEEGKLLLSVSDQGLGIAPQERDKLFSKYGTLSTTPQNQEKSTGLGLHSAKMMMERMGGQIYLDESYSEGAKFVLLFQKVELT